MTQPEIPAHLANRPTVGGLVVPAITPKVNGKYLFGQLTAGDVEYCLRQRRCQVCAAPLGVRHPEEGVLTNHRRYVLLAREVDVKFECALEPPLCAPCAGYSAKACPMFNGTMDHYRKTKHPDAPVSELDALMDSIGIPPSLSAALRHGAPAEKWFAVWVSSYEVIKYPGKVDALGASWKNTGALKVRPLRTEEA